jgi:hypothetical protein
VCKSFNDVRGDRERRTAQLTAELEALVSRKRFQRKLMQPNEQIVRALPGDQ